jgi:hypothetical protein
MFDSRSTTPRLAATPWHKLDHAANLRVFDQVHYDRRKRAEAPGPVTVLTPPAKPAGTVPVAFQSRVKGSDWQTYESMDLTPAEWADVKAHWADWNHCDPVLRISFRVTRLPQ